MVQEINCTHFLLNWKKVLLLLCIVEEDFGRDWASNQRHLNAPVLQWIVVFKKRTLGGGGCWLHGFNVIFNLIY